MSSIEKVRQRAELDAESHGYHLNPDQEMLGSLLEGLRKNEERYGYPSCPCRLATGNPQFDRDIICPCDYRDPDVQEYGYCYCALYMRKDVYEGETPVNSIPERRPIEKQMRTSKVSKETSTEAAAQQEKTSAPKMKLWYCKQCGYVCLREDPPYVCPICQAKKEMFSKVHVLTTVSG